MTNQNKLTAVIFGSTGLTGKFLTELLIKDDRYERLVLFVRKESKVYHGKIRQVVFNPDRIEDVLPEINGDQLFCCLGTTIKKAGSQEAFYKTDHHLIVDIAKASKRNNIPVFTVISSLGANATSKNFYLNTKGNTEEVLKSIGFKTLSILRPSLLLGIRPERRPLEEISKVIFKALGFVMAGKLKKYKPVHAETVAKAMIISANGKPGLNILESDKIEILGSQNLQ